MKTASATVKVITLSRYHLPIQVVLKHFQMLHLISETNIFKRDKLFKISFRACCCCCYCFGGFFVFFFFFYISFSLACFSFLHWWSGKMTERNGENKIRNRLHQIGSGNYIIFEQNTHFFLD